MISYEEALALAKKKKDSPVDNCEETENAYIFGSHADDMNIGGEGPVVIMKDNAKVLNMSAYLDLAPSKTVREFEVK